MGAELGATASVFPYDAKMAAYLVATSRRDLAGFAETIAAELRPDPEVLKHPQKYFDQVIEGSTDTESAYIYKALSYKNMNKPDDCIKAYTDGLEKNPQSAQLKDGLFKYYKSEGKNHYIAGTNSYKATVAKVNAQKLKPTDPAYAVESEKAKKEFNTAIELINKSLAINPDDADAKQVKTACEQSLKAMQ